MDYSISRDSSWFIGDSQSDILAAKMTGIPAVRIEQNESLLVVRRIVE